MCHPVLSRAGLLYALYVRTYIVFSMHAVNLVQIYILNDRELVGRIFCALIFTLTDMKEGGKRKDIICSLHDGWIDRIPTT